MVLTPRLEKVCSFPGHGAWKRIPEENGIARPPTHTQMLIVSSMNTLSYCLYSQAEGAILDFTFLKVVCDPFTLQGPLRQTVTCRGWDCKQGAMRWAGCPGTSGDPSPLTKGFIIPQHSWVPSSRNQVRNVLVLRSILGVCSLFITCFSVYLCKAVVPGHFGRCNGMALLPGSPFLQQVVITAHPRAGRCLSDR